MRTATPEETGEFQHEALLYADQDEFLAGVAPLVREALDQGLQVLAAVRASNARLLRAELGADAERMRFADKEALGRNPARIIPIWRDFVDAYVAAGRGALGIGEPVWPGRTEAELVECHHHESLLNTAFASGPAWRLVCPYDAGALDDAVLEEAARSHSVVNAAGVVRSSGTYVPSNGRPFTGPLTEPPADAERFEFDADEVAALRHHVVRRAAAANLTPERSGDLGLAVTELVSNSVRHGGGSGSLRLWIEYGWLICEVTDAGRFRDSLVGRLRPSSDRPDGRGLWLTNQICDLVQIRNAPEGARVRLQMRIAGTATPSG